jgi:acylphosphatase
LVERFAMATIRVEIKGRVQGVGYRYWAANQADSLDLDGWVRNRRDGSVEAVFSGKPKAIQAMLALCHKGPTMARVTNVAEFSCDQAVEPGFQTRQTG